MDEKPTPEKPQKDLQPQTVTDSLKPPHKVRKKRPQFKIPAKFPFPVKALWNAATEEEKQLAHRTGVALLQVWLGQISREEAAQQLEISPLRIWQLSQQAVSGMLSGLLTQPRTRKGATALMACNSAKAMEKKLREMEVQLKIQQELIDLLKSFPAYREDSKPGKAKGKKKTHQRNAPKPKTMAPEPSNPEGGKTRGS